MRFKAILKIQQMISFLSNAKWFHGSNKRLCKPQQCSDFRVPLIPIQRSTLKKLSELETTHHKITNSTQQEFKLLEKENFGKEKSGEMVDDAKYKLRILHYQDKNHQSKLNISRFSLRSQDSQVLWYLHLARSPLESWNNKYEEN